LRGNIAWYPPRRIIERGEDDLQQGKVHRNGDEAQSLVRLVKIFYKP
jgi:hypothetical protein